jgi:hypothetical protein
MDQEDGDGPKEPRERLRQALAEIRDSLTAFERLLDDPNGRVTVTMMNAMELQFDRFAGALSFSP